MAEPVRQPVPAPQPGGIAARAMGARSASYLADLNPEQREAVETLDGPVLVLAGAGTGKTRVLTTRIAHILNLGRARPSEILSVTFTNKAAREMKDRVGLMVGQVVEGMPWMGTFHSIGVKILRRHAELVFPHQRALDESGKAGLEEERRLAHVGLTRARKRAKIYFATNRRIHGMWTSTVPSRFLDELPAEHVEVTEAAGGAGGFGMSGYGPSRFDEMASFGSNYTTPGWQRAQGRKGRAGFLRERATPLRPRWRL